MAAGTESDYVCAFDAATASSAGPEVLGGKGAGLAHMTALGLPVPPGFTVTCQTARQFRADGVLPEQAQAEIELNLGMLEAQVGRNLGAAQSPLLVSVRSGAPVSMPGMMDTILNVGLNADSVLALARETENEEFAWSCYARLLETYARVVRGISAGDIEDRMLDLPGGAKTGERETAAALLELVEDLDGRPVPDDPREQVREATLAVFRSWDSPRAKSYRRFRGIDDELCTAATVQAMVFGNRGGDSASGVAFTRDPSSGAARPFGDILFNAQGEEVVAGERDAEPLDVLTERLPEVASELERTLAAIEEDARDMCEVEFTIERGTLWILQTRVGQRSGRAAVRTAVALVDDEAITIDEAVARITPAQLEAAAAPGFEEAGDRADLIAHGLAASPGAATGRAVFDPSRAAELAADGEDVVLLRPTTSPADVAGFIAATGVVTGRGGRTSHAAVVARGMHRPAVCGVGEVRIGDGRTAGEINGVGLREGDLVSVDGDRGRLLRGAQPLGPPVEDPAVRRFVSWCQARTRAPVATGAEIDGLPVGRDTAALEDNDGPVVLELDDPRAIDAPALAKALRDHRGPPPFLRVTGKWLRSADTRIRGRVAGIDGPESSPSLVLLQATLESDG